MAGLSVLLRRVRPTAYAVMLVTIANVLTFSQDFKPATSSNAKEFLGTWQASFKGKPFMTVMLSANNGKVTGTVSQGNVDLNKAGELTKAEASDGEDPITDAQVNGNLLRITTKSTDGSEDSMQWELKVIGQNEAELRMLGVASDVPVPKPWQLKRVAVKP